jgi:hypothetical protein
MAPAMENTTLLKRGANCRFSPLGAKFYPGRKTLVKKLNSELSAEKTSSSVSNVPTFNSSWQSSDTRPHATSVARFFWVQCTKLPKIYQMITKLQNDHKIYQMAVIYIFWRAKNKPRPSKNTQTVIFGKKIYHLATQHATASNHAYVCRKVKWKTGWIEDKNLKTS